MPRTSKAKSTPTSLQTVLKLRPRNVDRKLLRQLVGDSTVRSYASLAEQFGVSELTVRNNWAMNGMPGRGTGRYKLLDVLVWRLGRLNENDVKQSRQSSELRERRERAEAEKVELQAERLRFENERELGAWIRLADAQTAISTILAVLSQRLTGIPHEVAPSLPEKTASVVVPHLQKKIVDHLRWCSEELARKVVSHDRENT